ncbi:N-acyl homoserine lactonase [Tolypocladium paradoxum]|uniref:N-acyl homoserine lactonase n=1 Tax=Tolypocladium paradoxum TaxID=94208 RepID=A0A2S4KX76_9HYPO|nr:N-acyl homoserine lactonase [Tolypocladium paradoxum]
MSLRLPDTGEPRYTAATQLVGIELGSKTKSIDGGAISGCVSNLCPQGTKFHVLEVGWLEFDEGYVIRGGNSSLKSTEGNSSVNKRRDMELPLYCILIDHPHEGLILWETGCGKDYPLLWGPVLSDVFARVRYEPQDELRTRLSQRQVILSKMSRRSSSDACTSTMRVRWMNP